MRHSTIINRVIPVVLLLALIHVSLPAAANEVLLEAKAPSRGTGLIVWGSVLTGVGTAALATAAIAYLDARDDPFGALGYGPIMLWGIAGGVLVSVGLPLLITGSLKRARYNEWRDRHPATAVALEGLSVNASSRGGQLGWRYRF